MRASPYPTYARDIGLTVDRGYVQVKYVEK